MRTRARRTPLAPILPLILLSASAALLAASVPAAADGSPAGAAEAASPTPPRPVAERVDGEIPNVLWVTVDTLRHDRLSAYGYERQTSPAIDRLLARGARFTEARTIEPLTNPALSSMVTSLYPNEHGGTRNGLRMRPDLPSLPKLLRARGYQTAAFVGNWTLKDRVSGLGEHFQTYEEVLTRKRYFGLFNGEATAEDLTDEALEWLEDHGGRRRPFLLWVHYVEPHEPYVLQDDHAERMGIPTRGKVSRSDRYDTEIGFADEHIGRLLAAIERDPSMARRTIVVFTADHGESLGEHGYWGHGRNLYEPNLHIPLGIVWPGRIRPQVVEAPAVLLDVAPTMLGLLGLPPWDSFRGYDWSPVLTGPAPEPEGRVTWYEAHKGAVTVWNESENAREKGLLEVARLERGQKEIHDMRDGSLRVFDLTRDPGERRDLAATPAGEAELSTALAGWLADVEENLRAAGDLPPPALDPEAIEKLKALGYAD